MTDADLGDEDIARRSLQFLADELLARPRDGLWLPAVAIAALVAARLPEPAAVGRLYHALLPYRTQIIVGAMPHPVVRFGSASFYLGLSATASSRWAEAGDHFEAAIAAHERPRAGPILARTRYQYARMLLARGQAGDRRRTLQAAQAVGTSQWTTRPEGGVVEGPTASTRDPSKSRASVGRRWLVDGSPGWVMSLGESFCAGVGAA